MTYNLERRKYFFYYHTILTLALQFSWCSGAWGFALCFVKVIISLVITNSVMTLVIYDKILDPAKNQWPLHGYVSWENWLHHEIKLRIVSFTLSSEQLYNLFELLPVTKYHIS